MITYVDLKSLPPEHSLRNTPLAQISAQNKWEGSEPATLWNGDPPQATSPRWNEVKPSWKIAGCSFNDLGPAWTAITAWRAPDVSAHG